MALEDNLDKVLFTSTLPLNRIIDSGEHRLSMSPGTISGGTWSEPGRGTHTIAHGQDFAPFSFCLYSIPEQDPFDDGNPFGGDGVWFEIGTAPANKDGNYGYNNYNIAALCWTDANNLTLRGVQYWVATSDDSIEILVDIKWFLYEFGDNI